MASVAKRRHGRAARAVDHGTGPDASPAESPGVELSRAGCGPVTADGEGRPLAGREIRHAQVPITEQPAQEAAAQRRVVPALGVAPREAEPAWREIAQGVKGGVTDRLVGEAIVAEVLGRGAAGSLARRRVRSCRLRG